LPRPAPRLKLSQVLRRRSSYRLSRHNQR
jgi:hypothetical protein